MTKSDRPCRVVLLNDDETPMHVVVDVLEAVFAIDRPLAIDLMLTVHRQGRAEIGTFSRDVAETRVAQVTARARSDGHPLQCVLEEE